MLIRHRLKVLFFVRAPSLFFSNNGFLCVLPQTCDAETEAEVSKRDVSADDAYPDHVYSYGPVFPHSIISSCSNVSLCYSLYVLFNYILLKIGTFLGTVLLPSRFFRNKSLQQKDFYFKLT